MLCPECGTLHRVRRAPAGVTASCRTCGALLYRQREESVQRALALTVAALLLFVIAHALPFMTFAMEGNSRAGTILGSVAALWRDGAWQLAIVVLLLATVMPLAKLLLELWVLVPLSLGRIAPGTGRLFALANTSRLWAMTEIYLLAVLVAYVKLRDLATIQVGPALWAFVGLILAIAAADNLLDRRAVWWRLQPQARLDELGDAEMLAGCHTCGQVVPLASGLERRRCPRCGAPVHRLKPDSVARSWAFLLAAAVLYVPANVYPVMTVTTFGRSEPSTILGGVVELTAAGMWPVAALVFFASIAVPVLKILGLGFLLLMTRWPVDASKRDLARLYRLIEQVGRWSMIDIFMIAILAVLVDLGEIARIEPGPGALAFASVVVLTMLAAMSFEPKLIWRPSRATAEA